MQNLLSHTLAGRINTNDSLFTYSLGQSAATFNNTSFTPVFDLSDLPFANLDGMDEVCGDNIQCLFDVGATGNLEVGQTTVAIQLDFNEAVELSQQSKYQSQVK